MSWQIKTQLSSWRYCGYSDLWINLDYCCRIEVTCKDEKDHIFRVQSIDPNEGISILFKGSHEECQEWRDNFMRAND